MNRRRWIKLGLFIIGGLTWLPDKIFPTMEPNKRKKIIRKIAELGNSSLRLKADVIGQTDLKQNRDLKQLIDDMSATLDDSGGVGLAAPQVFENRALFLFMDNQDTSHIAVAINPRILDKSTETEKAYEGCLSIPGIRALVPRHRWIKVSYIDRNNQRIEKKLSGFIARIFQHEFDHLTGTVYLDRVVDNRDIISEAEFQKIREREKKAKTNIP